MIAIVFIHGLAGSRRFWDKVYHALSKNYSLYFIDLLGFGLSAKPDREYTLKTHTQALRRFMEEKVGEKSIILVGYSIGAIIALSYASKNPDKIKKIYLLSLPYYHSEKEAKDSVWSATTPSYFAVDSFWTKASCNLICYIGGPITRKVAHFLIRDFPKESVHDAFLHTYQSYISTLYNVLYKQDIPVLLRNNIKEKIILIHGEKDKVSPLKNVKELAGRFQLKLIILSKKDHRFPISAKEQVLKLIT